MDVTIEKFGAEQFIVKFKYSSQFVERIKKVPDRKYGTVRKSWIIPNRKDAFNIFTQRV